MVLGNSAVAQVKAPMQIKEQQTIRFYPNPAVNLINFEFKEKPRAPLSLYIFNFLGKKVIEQTITNQKTVIDLTDLYRGMYIFQIRNTEGVITETGKFQITK